MYGKNYEIDHFTMGHIKSALMAAGSAKSQYALRLISDYEKSCDPSGRTQKFFDDMHDECKKWGSE